VLQPVAANNPTLMVGSADLSSSTKVVYKKSRPFTANNLDGQNINFGVREFAMTAIATGITAHDGCKGMSSTFLAFSDYAKAAVRVAAVSHIPSINVYSHDSITVGEDGPTHQPIEQIATLRCIPNTYTFRPFNKQETAVALYFGLTNTDKPTQILTSRGEFKQYESNYDLASKGAYVIYTPDEKNYDFSIFATGSEVAIAISVAKKLATKNIKARVISVLSLDLFKEQSRLYMNKILDNKPKVSIEYGINAP